MVNMIGKVLGGRYEIVEKIGDGGMAIVYKAKCKLLNRYVAVKILRNEYANDEEFRNKFKKESQAAASLSHQNIVGIYDVGVEDNIYYIVMEYIKGKTLKQDILEKRHLSPEETVDYSIQIAEALEHAHKNNIIHRDIKPHNIMVTEEGRIKVTDFGIARAVTSSTITNTNSVIGSVHYFSPEQARGGYTDEKSDIYSLGMVMYEMVTGKVPFEGESPISIALKHIQEDVVPPSQIQPDIPKNLEAVIMKCVRRNQGERYKNATELLRDLRRIRYFDFKDNSIENTSSYDSPTRIIPAIEEQEEDDEMTRSTKKKSKKKKNNNEGGKKVVFFGILLAFIVASGIFVGFFKFKGLLGAKEIPVPDLEGLHQDVAKEKVESLGLVFKIKDEIYSADFDEGKVVSQSVEPGKLVKKGFPIEVVISKGSKLTKVPNFVNRNISEIDILLEDAGLDEGLVEPRYSDTVPRDVIISQDPEPYTEVAEGTKINFVVSKGPEVKTVKMPNLIGANVKDAKRVLVSSGLAANVIEKASDEVPKGEVIWQSYNPGTELDLNTTVDLHVSSGPNKKEDEKDNQKPSEPQEEKIQNLNISLPQDKSQVEVKVIRIQDGTIVYNKMHDTSEEMISVPVKGKGKVKFEIYIDEEYYDTKEISF